MKQKKQMKVLIAVETKGPTSDLYKSQEGNNFLTRISFLFFVTSIVVPSFIAR
jgi:hypothetical protein